ncbi:YkyA family protein [Alkalihalobacillus pseudalcaliphilus]|uniref:YkyA family protein n=1 Tax=Alkalihalobacillus pseudalcaliphilus TaxID=79884 RepID=UPI00069D27A9|nr:YkyA family protein [Alkalihalobacillus pseudalcaliphilus]
MLGKKGRSYLLIVMTLFLLTGCGNDVADKVFEHLEKAVELEAPFTEQQELISQAEENEQELYDEVIDLSMEEFEKILSLTEEALASIETREEAVAVEKESIEAGYQEFLKVEELESEIKDDEGLPPFQGLVENMHARYNSYQDLHNAYVDSLELDRALFELLQQEEEFDLVELQQLIEDVNASYQVINEARDIFNEYTAQYNNDKQSYYSESNLSWELAEENE